MPVTLHSLLLRLLLVIGGHSALIMAQLDVPVVRVSTVDELIIAFASPRTGGAAFDRHVVLSAHLDISAVAPTDGSFAVFMTFIEQFPSALSIQGDCTMPPPLGLVSPNAEWRPGQCVVLLGTLPLLDNYAGKFLLSNLYIWRRLPPVGDSFFSPEYYSYTISSVEATTIYMKDVTMVGQEDMSRGVEVSLNSFVYAEGCIFVGHAAPSDGFFDSRGGAIQLGEACTASFVNCTFRSNRILTPTAPSGGDSSNWVCGGAIGMHDRVGLRVDNCIFENNTAQIANDICLGKTETDLDDDQVSQQYGKIYIDNDDSVRIGLFNSVYSFDSAPVPCPSGLDLDLGGYYCITDSGPPSGTINPLSAADTSFPGFLTAKDSWFANAQTAITSTSSEPSPTPSDGPNPAPLRGPDQPATDGTSPGPDSPSAATGFAGQAASNGVIGAGLASLLLLQLI